MAAPSGPMRRGSSSRAAHAYASIYRHLLWPAWERVARRRATAEHLAFVEAMQWRSMEEVERYQLHALRQLLTHAGRRVPYWRELFARVGFDPRDVRRREDLEALPLLTREMVREHRRDLVDPTHLGVNVKKSTSGSTGAPLQFEYSPDSESWRQAIRIRGYSWAGYRPGLPTFYYWAPSVSPTAWRRALKIRLDRAAKRETFFDSIQQDEQARHAALAELRRTKPAVIVCYTQSCAQFARWIVENGHRDWDDIPVLCGAEAVLAADRTAIAQAFGPHVFETYGARETMLLASECERHDGMHLQEENVLVEVVRPGSQTAAAAGEAGDVVVTDLHNYGMPFIRYQNGDVARMAAATPCACGRGLRRLRGVDGRRADTLIDRDGNAVPGIAFHVLFCDANSDLVRQFQAVQRPTGEVVLRVVRGRRWSQERFDALVARFDAFLHGLPLSIEFHDRIAPAANGKMRTVVVERA